MTSIYPEVFFESSFAEIYSAIVKDNGTQVISERGNIITYSLVRKTNMGMQNLLERKYWPLKKRRILFRIHL